MWHLNRDALTDYKGVTIYTTVKDVNNIVSRIYTKDFGKKRTIRVESVERPNIPLEQAIQERLNGLAE